MRLINKIFATGLILVTVLSTTHCTTYLAIKTIASDLPPGTTIDDTYLDYKIQYQLATLTPKNAEVSSAVHNRTALVVGFVPNRRTQREISHMLINNQYLKHYINLTTIAPHPPVVDNMTDTMLGFKVSSNMIGYLNPLQFKVIGFYHQIYIMGYATPAEHKMALYLASHTDGVSRVIDLIHPYPSPHKAAIQCITIDAIPCKSL